MAAQVGFDLSIKSAMAFFSWPSNGNEAGYPGDEASIEASEPFFKEFLEKALVESGATSLHIIAHSMGNRGLLRTLLQMTQNGLQHVGRPFGQIILAAPDVDADVFRAGSGVYAKLSRQTTLYISDKDRAVALSRWLHDYDRIGLAPPITVMPEIDTVHIGKSDVSLLGHGYVSSCRQVLNDMHQILSRAARPNARFGIESMSTENGDVYWRIRD